MEKPAPAAQAPLANAAKLPFGVLARLPVAMLAFWALLTTTSGEGPSVGGRGMVLLPVPSYAYLWRQGPVAP